MASPSTTALASGALVLAGCAVGLILGRWTAPSLPAFARGTELPVTQLDLTSVVAELQRINESILRVRRQADEGSRSEAGTREAVATSPEVLHRLALAVEKLNDRLPKGDGHVGVRSPAMERWKGPGYPSMDLIWQRAKALSISNSDDWNDKLSSELSQAHLAWLRDEVLDRYGAPTAMEAFDRGLGLIYQREVAPGEARVVEFGDVDGLVMWVAYK